MKNKIYILVVLIIFLLLSALTIYKFFYLNLNSSTSLIVNEEKKKISETNDKEKYKSSIINNKTLSFDFDLIIDEESILGKVYIDNYGYLNIFDSKNNIVEKISSYKFIDLKSNNIKGAELSFYAISSDKKINYFYLDSLDISNVIERKISTDFYVESFTNLKFRTIDNVSSLNIFVLADDNKIYDALTGMRYEENIISLRDTYYVYNDNTVANIHGNMIKDNDGKLIKIKYYIETWEDDRPFSSAKFLIITSDNNILYTDINDKKINIYNNKIKNVAYDKREEIYNGVKITITFTNNSKKEFTGMFYEEYFGLK